MANTIATKTMADTMDYSALSPTKCANEIFLEILKVFGITETDPRAARIHNLLRQQSRLIYEQCAQISEDYVAKYDPREELLGEQVGDACAEMFRIIADERRH